MGHLRHCCGSTGFLIVAGLSLGGAACSDRPATLMLVTIAGFRQDAVSAGATPRLAALAARGRVADDVYTPAPDDVLALAGLMTGADPEEKGLRFGDLARLPAGVSTLAEFLKTAGFSTAAFVGQRDITVLTGLGRGFDLWSGPSASTAEAVTSDELERLRSGGGAAKDLADQVALWLRQHSRDKKAFVWVHFGDLPGAVTGSLDPHAAYSKALAEVDQAIGFVEDALTTYGRGRRPVIAVVSLHGMSLGEDGETLFGLRGADSVVRVPVLIAGPRKIPSPPQPTSLVDVGDLLRTAMDLEPAGQRKSAGVVRTVTHLPRRRYGWPDQGVAVSREGTLRLDPAPRWTPTDAGSEVAGDQAWRLAPSGLRESLESAGLRPAVPAADAPRILGLMGEGMQALIARDGAAAIRKFEEAAAAAPGAIAPRLALLQVLTYLPKEEQARRKSEVDALISDIKGLAAGAAPLQFDLAEALANAGRGPEALAVWRQLATQPLSSGEVVAVAKGLADGAALDEAATLVEKLVASEPEAPELQEFAGDLLNRAGNAFRARAAYERAITCPHGRSANLLAKLGDALASLGEKDAALARYAEAVQVDPSYRYPHARAADILQERGDPGAAAQAVVMSLPPTGDLLADALARSRALSARGLLRAAALELDKGLKERPGDERLTVALAQVLTDAGQTGAARERLQPVLVAHPENALALVELARAEALENRPGEAMATLRRAEATAGPSLTQRVRTDPAFRKDGENSALARAAASFSGSGAPPSASAGTPQP